MAGYYSRSPRIDAGVLFCEESRGSLMMTWVVARPDTSFIQSLDHLSWQKQEAKTKACGLMGC